MNTGRTARIGNEGLATSFFCDKNTELAPDLVKILIECGQTIPDFLQSYKPEGDHLDFQDDTDDEANPKDGADNLEGSTDAWAGIPMEPVDDADVSGADWE